MRKDHIVAGFIILFMFILLYMMTRTYREIQGISDIFLTKKHSIPLLKMTIWGYLFGMLLDWKLIFRLIDGQFKINWLLIPSILLTIIIFIPLGYWVIRFGVDAPFYIQMLLISQIKMLITAFTGLLFIRSLG